MKEEKDILARLTALEEKLKQDSNNPMNFHEACEYLGFAPSTLYKLTYQNIIPHYKPTGKRLYFFKKELDEWIVKGSDECRVMSDELKKEKFIKADPNQIEMALGMEDTSMVRQFDKAHCRLRSPQASLSASSEKDSSAGSTPLTTGSLRKTKEVEIVIELPLKSRRKK